MNSQNDLVWSNHQVIFNIFIKNQSKILMRLSNVNIFLTFSDANYFYLGLVFYGRFLLDNKNGRLSILALLVIILKEKHELLFLFCIAELPSLEMFMIQLNLCRKIL